MANVVSNVVFGEPCRKLKVISIGLGKSERLMQGISGLDWNNEYDPQNPRAWKGQGRKWKKAQGEGFSKILCDEVNYGILMVPDGSGGYSTNTNYSLWPQTIEVISIREEKMSLNWSAGNSATSPCYYSTTKNIWDSWDWDGQFVSWVVCNFNSIDFPTVSGGEKHNTGYDAWMTSIKYAIQEIIRTWWTEAEKAVPSENSLTTLKFPQKVIQRLENGGHLTGNDKSPPCYWINVQERSVGVELSDEVIFEESPVLNSSELFYKPCGLTIPESTANILSESYVREIEFHCDLQGVRPNSTHTIKVSYKGKFDGEPFEGYATKQIKANAGRASTNTVSFGSWSGSLKVDLSEKIKESREKGKPFQCAITSIELDENEDNVEWLNHEE